MSENTDNDLRKGLDIDLLSGEEVYFPGAHIALNSRNSMGFRSLYYRIVQDEHPDELIVAFNSYEKEDGTLRRFAVKADVVYIERGDLEHTVVYTDIDELYELFEYSEPEDGTQPGYRPTADARVLRDDYGDHTRAQKLRIRAVAKAVLELAAESILENSLSGEQFRFLSTEMLMKEFAGNEGTLCFFIASTFGLGYNECLALIAEPNVEKRLRLLYETISDAIAVARVEQQLDAEVQKTLDDEQRNYFLNQKLEKIKEMLGDSSADPYGDVLKAMEAKKDKLPDYALQKLGKEYRKLETMPPSSPDAVVCRTYIDKCLELPWGEYTADAFGVAEARAVLDSDHYGMEKVKERIIEYLAAKSLSDKLNGQIICLVGPPGVGKTSMGRSIARAMGRKYARVALGGVHDETEIRGHRRTYVGALPGRIIDAIINAGSANPVLLLDEIDKLGADYKGDPAYALLEVLDGEQNSTFTDHYIDMPFDLSRVMFITTANDLAGIPPVLADRMEIIELPAYTPDEKLQIAKKHLVPKQRDAHDLKAKQFSVTDGAMKKLIDEYTLEAGVRSLERHIASLCRKCAVKILEGENGVRVNVSNLAEYIGAPKITDPEVWLEDRIGVVNGLVVSSLGGDVSKDEVVTKGMKKVIITGNAGETLKESVSVAMSVTARILAEYNYEYTGGAHFHFPFAGIKKDGPSGGVATVTALVSSYTEIPVRGSVAMTGEITLRGRVMPIGGLKEKIMGAYRRGIRIVIFPFGNLAEAAEVPEDVRKKMELIPVREIEEVLAVALTSPLTMQEPREKKPVPGAPARDGAAPASASVTA